DRPAMSASFVSTLPFSLFFSCDHRSLPSFPTRRSSDLDFRTEAQSHLGDLIALRRRLHANPELGYVLPFTQQAVLDELGVRVQRSEEHTSELQSRFDLVCRLLLEKKKIHDQLQSHDY